ncbi:MAG: anhydro-N-acetylmuramic acid kinase [Zetaproteobacteria bacterium CG_4_9_14_3_um_filter_49_83]|nr:MAG: anhydro-N-acetylmuramic acid kinase [Zetaproteobacteria bacterium CG1_02_49_23]PIQ34697.1 MAG: anhydro-N-acetylmuramic acid kinase [Zetaproteobacteria bacterium CG17_big_fil_post_rev_8_21_14_2_50_50_13]PIV30003.1 MAG: anhydro-N-acetylmuramic acid kinase [Zetaproteobacteria bacterium CG02_land_8_20_14_3_00_50_9]PIY54992.1 MAG: anhydro-N-acetylmuramic acid kinase [Zetaproteobacteria bacterium CG_4_10_14_0_8_um_filter_49_80]PJA34280.1 MAG: anhydro-N-acetylmuramic acid kinase [Zetaproteobac
MNHATYWIGMMSGTSCDGIDVAIIKQGPASREKPELLHFMQHPMPKELHEPALRLAAPGFNEIDTMGHLDRLLGRAFAQAVLDTLEQTGVRASSIAAICSHGQTIRHRPGYQFGSLPFTLQIGCADTIADMTGITTVSDFRRKDIAAGGEGAPLVPFAHQRLFASDQQNVIVVNIGGIANITWLGADGSISGFDCGPGNMVMDSLMLELTEGRQRYDRNGEMAEHGQVYRPLLERLKQHPFLSRKPPKSTGREEFSDDILNLILSWPDIDHASMLTTACEWTALCIVDALQFLPAQPARCLICGGGAYNPYLMQRLNKLLAPLHVCTTADAGIPPNAVEAVSFALLGQACIAGQANTLASVTGADKNVCGGKISPGNNWPEIMQLCCGRQPV